MITGQVTVVAGFRDLEDVFARQPGLKNGGLKNGSLVGARFETIGCMTAFRGSNGSNGMLLVDVTCTKCVLRRLDFDHKTVSSYLKPNECLQSIAAVPVTGGQSLMCDGSTSHDDDIIAIGSNNQRLKRIRYGVETHLAGRYRTDSPVDCIIGHMDSEIPREVKFGYAHTIVTSHDGLFAYVSDVFANSIRRVELVGIRAGITTTIAGNGMPLTIDGESKCAALHGPAEICRDRSGTAAGLLIMQKSDNGGGGLLRRLTLPFNAKDFFFYQFKSAWARFLLPPELWRIISEYCATAGYLSTVSDSELPTNMAPTEKSDGEYLSPSSIACLPSGAVLLCRHLQLHVLLPGLKRKWQRVNLSWLYKNFVPSDSLCVVDAECSVYMRAQIGHALASDSFHATVAQVQLPRDWFLFPVASMSKTQSPLVFETGYS